MNINSNNIRVPKQVSDYKCRDKFVVLWYYRKDLYGSAQALAVWLQANPKIIQAKSLLSKGFVWKRTSISGVVTSKSDVNSNVMPQVIVVFAKQT